MQQKWKELTTIKTAFFYNFGNIFVPTLRHHNCMKSYMQLKVAHVPLVELPKFGNSSPTIRKVRMNEVKVNNATKFSQHLQKWRYYNANGQEKWDGDNPSRKLQTTLSIAI